MQNFLSSENALIWHDVARGLPFYWFLWSFNFSFALLIFIVLLWLCIFDTKSVQWSLFCNAVILYRFDAAIYREAETWNITFQYLAIIIKEKAA